MVHPYNPAALAPHPRVRQRSARQVTRARVDVQRPAHPPLGRADAAAASVRSAPPTVAAGGAWGDSRAAGRVIAIGLALVSAAVLAIGVATPWPWSDEGATYLALQRDWQQLTVLLGSRDAPWVPYYALAKAWAGILQVFAAGMPTLVAVRLLSVAAASATVVVLYAIVARNAGRLGGILAALVLLSLPGFNRYAQEARGYALLALAATVSWLLCDRWLHPGRLATLTGSAVPAHDEPAGRRSTGLGAAAGYAVSLAATAAIHTFGLFQWPAHLVQVATASGGRSARVRRLAWFGLIGIVAVLLAGAQLTASFLHGTGPMNPQATRVVTVTSTLGQLVRGISVTTDPLVALPVALLALTGLFVRVDGRREFARGLLIWLVTPLALAIALGIVRTNLFRLRYWIAFLPPLAALAGLGILFLATAVARSIRGIPGAWGRGLARVAAVAVAIVALGIQAAVAAQPQQQLRSADGHSENLGRVMAIIAQARSAHSGLIVAISAPTANGMLAAVEPGLQRQNPLQYLDPTVPTVYTSPTPARVVRDALASGPHEVLWIHRGPQAAATMAHHLPKALAHLHPSVVWTKSAGTDWSAVLLRTGA